MRALLAAAMVLALGSGQAQAAAWHPPVRAAIRVAEHRAGTVSFAVRSDDRHWGWRAQRTVPSVSVVKAMFLVAYLNRIDRRLRHSDRRLLAPMIRRSDDRAASLVLGHTGPAAVRSVARRAHMRRFHLDPVIWGKSRIDAADQARFFAHIDREVIPRHRAYAMHLLATVTSRQRWGIGRVRLPGWTKYFKSGWGSGSGAAEHQVLLLRKGDRRVAAAVLITGSPSHAYAKRTLRLVLARLLGGLR